MPVITLETAPLSEEQKEKIVREFTETAAKYMNLPQEAFYVFIKESPLGNIGVGGKLLSKT